MPTVTTTAYDGDFDGDFDGVDRYGTYSEDFSDGYYDDPRAYRPTSHRPGPAHRAPIGTPYDNYPLDETGARGIRCDTGRSSRGARKPTSAAAIAAPQPQPPSS